MAKSENIFDRIIDFFVYNEDKRTKTWLLSSSPTPLIIILVTYLYFILIFGPKYMKNRKPYQLKNTLIVYNAAQVVLSLILVIEGLEGGWRKHYSFRCQPVDYSMNPAAIRMARAVWLYYMCKLIELMDTVFFVLRKKQNQISFLHIYHHTIMPFCVLSWSNYYCMSICLNMFLSFQQYVIGETMAFAAFLGVKYFAGGHGTLLGLINSFIHVLMYAYYMLSAIGGKNLWWKKYLTVMQIVQFLIVFVHTAQIQIQPNCEYSKGIGALLTLNAGFFTYMFSSFYIKTYLKKDKNMPATKLTIRIQDVMELDENKNVVPQNGKTKKELGNDPQKQKSI